MNNTLCTKTEISCLFKVNCNIMLYDKLIFILKIAHKKKLLFVFLQINK